MDTRSIPESGITGGEEPRITYRGKSVVLTPSERVRDGERTYDVRDADHPERIYTYLYVGTKGGFSGNRAARRNGTAEEGWIPSGTFCHPKPTPEAAALHYLKWSYRRSRRAA